MDARDCDKPRDKSIASGTLILKSLSEHRQSLQQSSFVRRPASSLIWSSGRQHELKKHIATCKRSTICTLFRQRRVVFAGCEKAPTGYLESNQDPASSHTDLLYFKIAVYRKSISGVTTYRHCQPSLHKDKQPSAAIHTQTGSKEHTQKD